MSKSKFAWFCNYTDMLNDMPTDELKLAFALGVANYGSYGVEPEFEDAILKLAFAGIKPNIDYSRSRSMDGSKGGKQKAANERERREQQAKDYVLPSADPNKSSPLASPLASPLRSEWTGREGNKEPDAGSVSYQSSSGEPIAFPVVSFG